MMKTLAASLICLSFAPAARAGEVEIVDAQASQTGTGWRFDVTLRHEDSGWDHYADGWEVLAPDGTRLGYRKLHHPHVNEQPFTRSLSGIVIPTEIDRITIRAHDNLHGWSDAVFIVNLR